MSSVQPLGGLLSPLPLLLELDELLLEEPEHEDEVPPPPSFHWNESRTSRR
jgi:hypothetical protein